MFLEHFVIEEYFISVACLYIPAKKTDCFLNVTLDETKFYLVIYKKLVK